MRAMSSISLRLGLLFATIATAAFVAVGAYLYGTLSQQMGHRDDVDLLNKAVMVRQVLGTLPPAERRSGHMPPVLSRTLGQDGINLQLSTPSG